MTNSVTVTSPDSTGSENGAQMQAYPVQDSFGLSVEMDPANVGEGGLGREFDVDELSCAGILLIRPQTHWMMQRYRSVM
jgi:hypothetical protein